MSSQELESMLRAWREESQQAQAPARVEDALREAFRARARRRRTLAALGAAAALALLAGGLAWWMFATPAPRPAIGLTPAPPVPALQPAPAPPPQPERPVVARRLRRAPRPRPQAEEVATDFLPLEETSSLPPIESGQVVRVQLSRATLVRLGLPVNHDRMMEPVNADVLFAQDGIARAIRFVK